jgi:[ribosomal protein S5]-alanine N-acetyltransferase
MASGNVFETDRLIVRPWRADDAEAAFAMHGDPEVTDMLPDRLKHTRIEQTERLLEELVCDADPESPLGFWAVVERASGAVIGGATLKRAPINGGHPVEIGYYFARSAWGHGFATELARTLLEHGFTHTDETEIWAVILPENTASRRVLEKIGMEHRGLGDYDGFPVEVFTSTRA